MRILLAALLTLLPGLSTANGLLARYEVTAAGLPVIAIEARYGMDATGYSVTSRARPVGVGRLMASGDQTTRAEGRWRGQQAEPRRYQVDGTWRGEQRLVRMHYADGAPQITRLLPQEPDRLPVPDAMQRNTIDGLSALAQLVRTVAETGRCDASAAVFDGRRRTDYAARTLGGERLAMPAGLDGTALRCGFEGRLLAGWSRDEEPDEARRPREGTAWILPARPGYPPVLLRVDLPTRWFGTIRMELVSAEPSTLELAQQQR